MTPCGVCHSTSRFCSMCVPALAVEALSTPMSPSLNTSRFACEATVTWWHLFDTIFQNKTTPCDVTNGRIVLKYLPQGGDLKNLNRSSFKVVVIITLLIILLLLLSPSESFSLNLYPTRPCLCVPTALGPHSACHRRDRSLESVSGPYSAWVRRQRSTMGYDQWSIDCRSSNMHSMWGGWNTGMVGKACRLMYSSVPKPSSCAIRNAQTSPNKAGLYPLIKHDTSAHGAETKTSGRLVIRSSAASAWLWSWAVSLVTQGLDGLGAIGSQW